MALAAAAAGYLMSNTLANMRARGIQSGFDFIFQPAGFAIGESILPFDAADSYGKAYLVGLSNTLRVAVAGIFAAVPYCIDLLGGPYLETRPEVIQAFRPKSAIRPPKE